MSASKDNNAAASRQVAREPSDNGQIPVNLDMLHLSRTFKGMYDDLGLKEHDVFPVIVPAKTFSPRIINKVIDWCKEQRDEPEPAIEKDPLTQECKWFAFTDHEKRFFDVPMRELLELVMAANFLDIPGLYHYACQSVAACIKGKRPRRICEMLQQHCDLDRAQIAKIRADNPWLSAVVSGVRVKNPIFIPNEVLLTIFEKLPREDLERLQLVSTQFNDLIVSSSKLSGHLGPLRVVTKLEFGAYPYGSRCSKRNDLWLRDGTRVTCAGYEDLAKHLKFSVVQKLRYTYRGNEGDNSDADVQDLCALLPVKSAWKNATVEAFLNGYASAALVEFAFAQLFLCKEVVLGPYGGSFSWSRADMLLPGVATCNKLDVGLCKYGLCALPAEVVEWLEHEVPPEKKWSEPRQMVLHERWIIGGPEGLLTALKTAFSASSSPKPYAVRILRCTHRGNLDEVLVNEKTHEVLSIRGGQGRDIFVKRA